MTRNHPFNRYLPRSFTRVVKQDILTTNTFIETLVQKHNVVAPKHGVIHVGAHKCEEQPFYDRLGLKNVLWIDGNDELCRENSRIVNALLSDEDGKQVDFIITSNDAMSSSILELKEHLIEHPDCVEKQRVRKHTTRLDTLMKVYDQNKYDMLVLDVQGAELLVLKGGTETLKNINCLVSEVNTKELYKDCVLLEQLDDFLTEQGFVRVFTNMTRHGWGDAVYVRRTITIKVHSGLGNRLFQLAFLYAIARRTNSLPVLYDEFIDVCKIHCADKQKYEPFYGNFERVLGSPCEDLYGKVSENPKNPCIYHDYNDKIRECTKPIIVFEGYFQSMKYFEEYEYEVRKMFCMALPQSNADVNMSCFIHVRGRDHVHPTNVAHRLDAIETYYSEAIEANPQCNSQNTVIITDDVTYAAQFDALQSFKILENSDELHDLSLMSMCKNTAITTNSTFSWWGAFLANSKKVIMPFPYLHGGMGYKDIYLEGSIKINASSVAPLIFDNILSARRDGQNITIILVRKGSKDVWINSLDGDILIDGERPSKVQYLTQNGYLDNYNNMCIIQGKSSTSTDIVNLTMNYITKPIVVQQTCQKKYKLVAMTTFKDDASLIESYVGYYKTLGVEHFFMYYNSSESVENLPNIQDVTYIQWPYPYWIEKRHYAQLGSMTDMIYHARSFADYVLFNDLDEYILWKPKHISLRSFVLNNQFAIYGMLNNFVFIDDPKGEVSSQIKNDNFSRTFEMPYGTRSKNIVNVHKVDKIGIHKPFDNSYDEEMCVLSSETCELLHVCNIHERQNASLTDKLRAELQNRINPSP